METQEMPLIQITTRIEHELAEEFAEIAKRERRSLSAQLIIAVEHFVDAYKQEQTSKAA